MEVARLEAILKSRFPGIQAMLERLPDDRITGSVIWAGFSEMDDVERQSEIRNELRSKLGTEAHMVGVLLAYTPDEISDMKAA